MTAVVAWLNHAWHGAPVWAWAAIVALVVGQDLLARSKKVQANAYGQAIGNIAKLLRNTLLGRFPVVGQILMLVGMLGTGDPAPVVQLHSVDEEKKQ